MSAEIDRSIEQLENEIATAEHAFSQGNKRGAARIQKEAWKTIIWVFEEEGLNWDKKKGRVFNQAADRIVRSEILDYHRRHD